MRETSVEEKPEIGQQKNYPFSLICSITNELFKDPIIILSGEQNEVGNTYEKNAYLTRYQQEHFGNSPPSEAFAKNYVLAGIVKKIDLLLEAILEEDTPAELLDPISCELFQNPVVVNTSNQTYSRVSIIEWLKKNLWIP